MVRFFSRIGDSVRRHKAFFIVLLVLTIAVAVLAVYSAISFEAVAITIDIANVTFVKFLKGDSSFLSLIFGTLIVIAVFYAIILLCCSKKFLLPFAILFYLYFVYSQMVILTSLIMIYGFFNTLILSFFLLMFFLAEFLVFILLFMEMLNFCGSVCFFKDCFNSSTSCLPNLCTMLLVLLLIFCLLIAILKSFIILLVF